MSPKILWHNTFESPSASMSVIPFYGSPIDDHFEHVEKCLQDDILLISKVLKSLKLSLSKQFGVHFDVIVEEPIMM